MSLLLRVSWERKTRSGHTCSSEMANPVVRDKCLAAAGERQLPWGTAFLRERGARSRWDSLPIPTTRASLAVIDQTMHRQGRHCGFDPPATGRRGPAPPTLRAHSGREGGGVRRCCCRAVGTHGRRPAAGRLPGGGVRVLVGPPVFKTGVSSGPAQAGSIPVRLRYQHFRLIASPELWKGACLLARFSSDPASSEASKVIRKRGDYWQVKVYAGRDLLTGRERYEYDRARTKREAERVEAALKTKVAEGRHRSTAARTVADLVERWFEWRQGVKEISPTTLLG